MNYKLINVGIGLLKFSILRLVYTNTIIYVNWRPTHLHNIDRVIVNLEKQFPNDSIQLEVSLSIT